jgi:ATP-dependent helicase/nuclease subunit B
MGDKRNVFTIAPGAPFLRTFVEAFLAGRIVPSISRDSPPLAMTRATIYVPTERAGRALATEFARAFDKGATLLPRILPLGGLEALDTQTLFGAADDDFDETAAPAIEELERRLLLSRLVIQWAESIGRAIVSFEESGDLVLDETEPFLVASSPAGAYALAADLGALIDEFIIEGVAANAVDQIVEERFDKYWKLTTEFLRIALVEWPNILAEKGLVDPAERQKRLLEAHMEKLAQAADHAPVIALGSTGAQKTTARLLTTIASLDAGAVVLPGLDCEMDAVSWSLIGASDDEPAYTHPQAMLKRLLGLMRLERDDVRELSRLPERLAERRRLVARALLPADATASWRDFRAAAGAGFDAALEDVAALAAPDERMEALALALFMREALETPGRTAALVTPDRTIARRVAAELARFEIEVDDSGGAPLVASPAGALARRIARAGADGLDAVAIATLLAHPLCALGRTRAEVEALAPLVEVGVLRAVPAGSCGYAGLVAAARRAAGRPHAHPAARRIDDAQWRAIEDVLRDLEAAFAPFLALRDARSLRAWATAHRAAFETLTRGAQSADEDVGQVLFGLFDRLVAADAPEKFDAASYAAFFERVAFETTLRGPRRAHPRLKILGPLEARLIDADLILLAGLDEGVWPPQTDVGAFLNRSMRRSLGLSPPERRIGQSAHDFQMALGARNVVLSRAAKRDGSPTVASRFLTRLEALAGDAFAPCRARGDRMLAIAAALDQPTQSVALARPEPRPPVELRPSRLSVTRVEVLRRDPYAIFAEQVLKLAPLAPLGVELGAREIGTAIHAALEAFVAQFPAGPLPADARERLREIAREKLTEFVSDPGFDSFTWPRLAEGLDHAFDFEVSRRERNVEIHMEKRGEWRLPLVDGSEFLLSATADRIEVDPSGEAYVFDYKTGTPPSMKQVHAGWSPQLTLEAAMIEAGAFELGAHPVAGAAYVGLKNGGKTQWIPGKDGSSFAELAAAHRDELLKMLSQYRDPKIPYPSRPYVALTAYEGDYDHLARVKEWSRGGGDGA